MFFFTITSMIEFKSSIMFLRETAGEAQRIDDDRQDFFWTQTVLVRKELYAFKFGSPVSV